MPRDPLDKVRKLLALARSSNVHEAASAAARAQELIQRYRLEELLEAEAEAEAEPVEQEVLERSRRQRRWKSVLASGLARTNDCLAFTRRVGREHELLIAGRAADRAALRSLWEWLVPQLEWLSATHGAGQPRRWHDDFRIGAIETILARLGAASRGARARVEPAALVRLEPALVARRAALQAFADERLERRRGRSVRVGLDAWEAGRAAGGAVPLERG